MFRVRNQATHAVHSRPLISISFFEESSVQLHWPSDKKTTKGPHIGHSYLMQTRLGLEGCGGVLTPLSPRQWSHGCSFGESDPPLRSSLPISFPSMMRGMRGACDGSNAHHRGETGTPRMV
jgi:hypothetical protein